MSLTMVDGEPAEWSVEKIAVVGPGIVGMPMATLLAHAGVQEGTAAPARVVVIQRPSANSGWKVDAINSGRSPIGGVEPGLDLMLSEAVAAGRLSASHDYTAARDADVILVCVQTDREGDGPAYGPLFEALDGLARALGEKPAGNLPLVIFESTLAPTSMGTVVREHFRKYGLIEGKDLLLGNSPNRVMPGRLVERVVSSDKLVAGLTSSTPGLIARVYRRVVTSGALHQTNSMTAEVVKTLENAYRDVRIAYAAELVRHCDSAEVDYYALRDEVNRRLAQTDDASRNPTAVPSGGLLIPTLGVGGHCLPKDGILLWWRAVERGLRTDHSLILEARRINDESPGHVVRLMERRWGALHDRRIGLLGAAYRFNSEDTRNSPTIALARLLQERGCTITVHDPYVKPGDQNIVAAGLDGVFTQDLDSAIRSSELVVACTAHRDYLEVDRIMAHALSATGFVDACNLLPDPTGRPGVGYIGVGRGSGRPSDTLVDAATAGFEAVERGVANELETLIAFLNDSYALTPFERVDYAAVQRLAATCGTGCRIVAPGPVDPAVRSPAYPSRLVARAVTH